RPADRPQRAGEQALPTPGDRRPAGGAGSGREPPGAGVMSVPYRIARLEVAEACVMPVRPGTEGDCRPGEPDDRTELCATDAWWLLGDLAVCDQHLRYALRMAGDDYEAMLARYRSRFPDVAEGIPTAPEQLPWSQRPRRLDHV